MPTTNSFQNSRRRRAHRRAAVSSDRVPIGAGAAAVEAWLADAGLPARVVERCPRPGCRVCGHRYPDAA
jgi:hypothetical protein